MVIPTIIVLLGDVNKTDNPCEVFKIMPGTKSTHTLCSFICWLVLCWLGSVLCSPELPLSSRCWDYLQELDIHAWICFYLNEALADKEPWCPSCTSLFHFCQGCDLPPEYLSTTLPQQPVRFSLSEIPGCLTLCSFCSTLPSGPGLLCRARGLYFWSWYYLAFSS